MKRSEAEALGVDLLELANAGAWAELLAMDLSGEALEILRRKAQLNTQIGSMEQQERLLWEMLLMELVRQSAAPMAKPRANGGASDPQRQAADLVRA
jgi:hydrogenase maturation factor